jgi:HEAT repeat protein
VINWQSQIDARVLESRNDPRTADELIARILTESDEEVAWELIAIMHCRGTRDVFDAAKALCQSGCVVERTLGANILGQLGVPDRTYPRESVDLLLGLLRTEQDEAVLDAALIALGHTHDPRAVSAVVRLANNPSANVRYAVAFSLQGLLDAVAIQTLIGLATDSAAIVRDWAMFALGTQIDADTPAIRNALFRGTADADEVARGEALVGLARRHDERAVEPLIRELSAHAASEYGRYAIEAAEELADPRLLPTLEQLKASACSDDDRFDEAIRHCSSLK